ncbi:HD domain-containing protein [Alkalicoccobacillus plakortidis]|uniref:HD domain-containing protein n=1 Tax=Alkalicoccobacillus plakortidis TaxID=444060 RepID=UPI0027D9AF65|nr:HD domain-containing protein [Alkalicoccobacillus plakortidis]
MNQLALPLTEEWVQIQLAGDTTGHDWYHIKRVTTLAQHLSLDTDANSTVVILASLLHDLADDKVVANEASGLVSITNWLNKLDVTASDIDHILLIITTMSFKAGTGKPMQTLEGQIVQDADRLGCPRCDRHCKNVYLLRS